MRIEREGIYRINGNAAQIQKLRVTVDDQVNQLIFISSGRAETGARGGKYIFHASKSSFQISSPSGGLQPQRPQMGRPHFDGNFQIVLS